MFKRPLLAAGLAAVIISVIIAVWFPSVVFPISDLNDGDRIEFECRVRKIEEKNSTVHIYAERGRYKLLLTCAKDQEYLSTLKIGNVISGTFRFVSWRCARNKGNFDEESYYRSLGIYQKYSAMDLRVTNSSYSLIGEILRRIRSRLITSISDAADEETAGILAAVTTGERTGIDSETKSLFQLSGISHIIAISGVHVSFIGMGLFRILRKKVRFIWAASAASFAVICYVLMSGASASSIRACIMMMASLGSMAAGRKYDMLSSASLAVVLLLISNPFYVTNPGFVMSFSAVAAITFVTGRKRGMSNPLEASIMVSAFTLPVIASSYYEMSLLGPLVNIAVLAVIPYLLGGAFAGGLIGMVSLGAGRIVMGMPVYLTKGLRFICSLVSNIPGSSITVGCPSLFKLVLSYLILILAVLLLRTILKNQKLFRITLEIMVYILMLIVISVRRPDSGLSISFIDVDQGECVLIVSETGHTYMIDAGSATVSDVYLYRIKSTLKYRGISSLDYVFITHPDTDHISGILEMLEDDAGGIRIGKILTSDFTGNDNYDEMIRLARKKDVNVSTLHEGYALRDGHLWLECIRATSGGSLADLNERSAVFLAEYCGFKALFTGDIGANEENSLVQDKLAGFDIDLLDVAHHGSRYSSSSIFLETISPETAVVSAGVDNSYGHPHKGTIARLENVGASVYNTADHGEIDISVDSDGKYEVGVMLE